MTDRDDLSHELARFAADARYAALPADAIEAAKKSLLDTLGVILAASGMEPAVKPLINLVQDEAGKEQCTILGFGGRVPASRAALANGALAHCLDFDDQTPWGAHPDSSVIPTVIALAELKGGVSGEDLITAIAVGQELFTRLRLNVGWHMDWNLSTAIGIFSATAAGGRVMRLSAEQIASAMGIASMQSSGTMELIFGVGSDLRGMYAGFTSQAAVQAVQLAQRGMTGIPNLFEGEAGHFKVYFKGEYNRDKMLEKLGTQFLSGGMLYKRWPAVGNAHTYIHAAIELMKENELELDQIKEIRVYVGDFQQRMCSPLPIRQAPGTLVDAKFSLPFLVALALAKGKMDVADFSSEALRDERILALARKVVPVPDASFNWTLKLPDGKLVVVMTNGQAIERLGSNVPGTADRPMTWDDLDLKFAACAKVAAKPIEPEKITRVQRLIRHLEACRDATELVRAIG